MSPPQKNKPLIFTVFQLKNRNILKEICGIILYLHLNGKNILDFSYAIKLPHHYYQLSFSQNN